MATASNEPGSPRQPDRRAGFAAQCLAAIWFEFVDRHTQHRCYQGNDDSTKAENKQAAAPEVSD